MWRLAHLPYYVPKLLEYIGTSMFAVAQRYEVFGSVHVLFSERIALSAHDVKPERLEHPGVLVILLVGVSGEGCSNYESSMRQIRAIRQGDILQDLAHQGDRCAI